MNLILFGFQGVGKTHFGKRLAESLHRPLVDTDDILCELYAIEKGERLATRDIYLLMGENGFRTLETQALATLLPIENAVISVGGGAVLDPGNVQLLQKIGQLIYLEASFETLKKRALNKSKPAAFVEQKDPIASLHDTYLQRKIIYESLPARRIQVDCLDEAEVLAALQSIACLEEPPKNLSQ